MFPRTSPEITCSMTNVQQHKLKKLKGYWISDWKWWGFQKSSLSRLFFLRRVLHYIRRQNAQKGCFSLPGGSSECYMMFWMLLRCLWISWLTTFYFFFLCCFCKDFSSCLKSGFFDFLSGFPALTIDSHEVFILCGFFNPFFWVPELSGSSDFLSV